MGTPKRLHTNTFIHTHPHTTSNDYAQTHWTTLIRTQPRSITREHIEPHSSAHNHKQLRANAFNQTHPHTTTNCDRWIHCPNGFSCFITFFFSFYPFWAAAPKGRCPVGHRGEFPYVRPYVRTSVRPPQVSQISNSHWIIWENNKMKTWKHPIE